MHSARYQRHGDASVLGEVGRPKSDDHGTEARYRAKCRCAECVAWKNEQQRQAVKRLFNRVATSETYLTCLKGFGIPEEKLIEARSKHTAERLHWGVWRVHGPFRKHCECELPAEILEDLEAV